MEISNQCFKWSLETHFDTECSEFLQVDRVGLAIQCVTNPTNLPNPSTDSRFYVFESALIQ